MINHFFLNPLPVLCISLHSTQLLDLSCQAIPVTRPIISKFYYNPRVNWKNNFHHPFFVILVVAFMDAIVCLAVSLKRALIYVGQLIKQSMQFLSLPKSPHFLKNIRSGLKEPTHWPSIQKLWCSEIPTFSLFPQQGRSFIPDLKLNNFINQKIQVEVTISVRQQRRQLNVRSG